MYTEITGKAWIHVRLMGNVQYCGIKTRKSNPFADLPLDFCIVLRKSLSCTIPQFFCL